MLSFFPRDVLGEILNLIESVSEGFPTYSWFLCDSRCRFCTVRFLFTNMKHILDSLLISVYSHGQGIRHILQHFPDLSADILFSDAALVQDLQLPSAGSHHNPLYTYTVDSSTVICWTSPFVI